MVKEINKSQLHSHDLINVVYHPLQSLEWGMVREALGHKVIYVGNYDNDRLVQVFVMSLHEVPHIGSYKIGYIPRSVIPNVEVIEVFRNIGKRESCIYIKFEPISYPPYGTSGEENLPSTLVESAFPLFPRHTQLLRLEGLNTLDFTNSLHPKKRYNLRLASKKGVTVSEESTPTGFETFQKLYFETCRRQKYHGHNYAYHNKVWENLSVSGIAKIFIARLGEVPLAAYQIWKFGNTMYYTYGGTSDTNRNLYASHLLMYECVKYGIENNIKFFDMWGSAPPNAPSSHPFMGFTLFKRDFNTEYYEFPPSLDLVIKPALYYPLIMLQHLRSKLL